MKITDVRTRVVEWQRKTVPPQKHFSTNPMDILELPIYSMGSSRFHSWLIIEVETDAGITGIGNAVLAPRVTKEIIDLYLKPTLISSDPFDVEYLWQMCDQRTRQGLWDSRDPHAGQIHNYHVVMVFITARWQNSSQW